MSKLAQQLLTLLFILFCTSIVNGQELDRVQLSSTHTDCVMPATFGRKLISKPYTFKSKPEQRQLNFTINYLTNGEMLSGNTCSTWPENAKTAFTYAMSIWSDVLENSQNIGVNACWTTSLATNTLGSAGPTNWLGLGAQGLPVSFFPVALAEHLLSGQDTTVDIRASFNANRSDWYFGTDANPGISEFDFVTVVLHELGHGLGFLGGSGIDDGVNNGTDNFTECEGVAGTGCVGLLAGDGNFYPTIFDQFIDMDDETSVFSLVNPSADVATVLEGGSTTGGGGGLEFDEENLSFFRDHGIKIYTPSTYNGGSSYSHFDESTPALANELMSPFIASGEAIHDVGLAKTVMEEMGWTAAIVPVKLKEFNVLLADERVDLSWVTSIEINNSHFEIEKSYDNVEYFSIGLINGKGNSVSEQEYAFSDRNPSQGSNYYRLKQVDLDGTVEYSDVKVVSFEDGQRGFALLQNPVEDRLRLRTEDINGSESQLYIYATTGKLLMMYNVVNDGAEVNVDINDLLPGHYIVRLEGSHHVFTKMFIKVR